MARPRSDAVPAFPDLACLLGRGEAGPACLSEESVSERVWVLKGNRSSWARWSDIRDGSFRQAEARP